MSEITIDEKIESMKEELKGVELKVLTEGYTLADAIREGDDSTGQEFGGFGDGVTVACALTSAYLTAKARGVIE